MAIQVVLFLPFLAVAGTSILVENIFGPTVAPVALAVGAGAYAWMKMNNVVVRANKIKTV
jgi:molybdopterin-binding protein